ncbi:MAG: O-acetyltransferase WecH [Anaerolineales bacterium]|nr:O-acetyltransferase WecH [Anaerolineales bacterium]
MNNSLAESGQRSSRLTWVDFLRVVSAFLVILVHSQVWGGGPAMAKTFYHTLARISVPIFFMLSGYLLLPKEESWQVFLKKRAGKVLIPFFFWSVVYDVAVNGAYHESGVTFAATYDMFLRILASPRAGHLWYLYALIGLYFFMPILRLFAARARNSDLLYYIALWLFVVPILFIVEAYTDIRIRFEMQFAAGFVGYLLIGLLLGRMELTLKRLWISAAVFAVSFLFCMLAFHYEYPPGNELPFRSHLSLNIIILASAAFPLLKAAGNRIPARFIPSLGFLSDSSFGVYLIHPLAMYWMELLWKSLGREVTSGSSIIVVPIVTVIAFSISLLITHILRRIPLLKYTVP